MPNRFATFTGPNNPTALPAPDDGGSAWIREASYCGIYGNAAYGAGNGKPTVASLECGSCDGTLQGKLAESAGHAGLMARVTPGGNGLFLMALNGACYLLCRLSAGQLTTIGQTSAPPHSGDAMRMDLAGPIVTVKINGVEVISVSETFNQSATRHGIGFWEDSASKIDDWSFGGGVPDPGTIGNLSLVTGTPQTVTVSRPAAAGGTPPWTYAIQSSLAADGTFADLPNSGNTPFTCAADLGWLRVRANDSANPPQVAVSNPIPVKPWAAPLKFWLIGDSQTANPDHNGQTNAMPAAFAAELSACLQQRSVTVAGNSAISGTHTADWLPGAPGTPLENAVTAALAAGCTHLLCVLGSNDSTMGGEQPVDPATFGSRMNAIAQYVAWRGLVFVTGYPTYYSISTAPVAFGTHAQALRDYQAQLDALDNGTTILVADKRTYYDIPANPQWLDVDGLHLQNPAGQTAWGKSLARGLAARL